MIKLPDLIYGDYPAHVHSDVAGNTWECNSPYCLVLVGLPHPQEGGPKPIIVGLEPWRGR